MRGYLVQSLVGIGLAAATAIAGAQSTPAAPSQATESPSWVAKSNAAAQPLLEAIAQFHPEFASRVGVAGYDDKVVDLKPGSEERQRAAIEKVRDSLQKALSAESDANVRQDLAILIKSADRRIDSSRLEEKYLLPYSDVGELDLSRRVHAAAGSGRA